MLMLSVSTDPLCFAVFLYWWRSAGLHQPGSLPDKPGLWRNYQKPTRGFQWACGGIIGMVIRWRRRFALE